MLILMLAFLQLRLEDAHRLVSEQLIDVTAAPAFIRQFIIILFVQCDIIHVVANLAEFHGVLHDV